MSPAVARPTPSLSNQLFFQFSVIKAGSGWAMSSCGQRSNDVCTVSVGSDV